MPNTKVNRFERADHFNRADAITIPTLDEIQSAQAAGVPCTNTWIERERQKAIQIRRATKVVARRKAKAAPLAIKRAPTPVKCRADKELDALRAELKKHLDRKV